MITPLTVLFAFQISITLEIVLLVVTFVWVLNNDEFVVIVFLGPGEQSEIKKYLVKYVHNYVYSVSVSFGHDVSREQVQCNLIPVISSHLSSLCNISNTRDSVSSGYPNTELRVENMTRSRVFFTKFEVFGKPMKHCLECLIYLLNGNKT